MSACNKSRKRKTAELMDNRLLPRFAHQMHPVSAAVENDRLSRHVSRQWAPPRTSLGFRHSILKMIAIASIDGQWKHDLLRKAEIQVSIELSCSAQICRIALSSVPLLFSGFQRASIFFSIYLNTFSKEIKPSISFG